MLTAWLATAAGYSRAVLLLVVCLAADSATPLLPGAFHFDASHSVETGRRIDLRVVAATVDVPTRSDALPVSRDATSPGLRSTISPPSTPRFVSVRRPARPDRSPDAPSDD